MMFETHAQSLPRNGNDEASPACAWPLPTSPGRQGQISQMPHRVLSVATAGGASDRDADAAGPMPRQPQGRSAATNVVTHGSIGTPATLHPLARVGLIAAVVAGIAPHIAGRLIGRKHAHSIAQKGERDHG